jgi:hypothetical protein
MKRNGKNGMNSETKRNETKNQGPRNETNFTRKRVISTRLRVELSVFACRFDSIYYCVGTCGNTIHCGIIICSISYEALVL